MKIIAIIAMLCAAAHAGAVVVAWDASAGAADYRVWKGIELLATVNENRAALTLPDEPCTLTVTARNSAGESAHSEPMHVIALPVMESFDLKAWKVARVIHREKKAKAFYKLGEVKP